MGRRPRQQCTAPCSHRNKKARPRTAAPGASDRLNARGDLLADALGLGEQEEVIRSARLGVGARHIEAAKRVRAHDGARALAIDVQVADVELALAALDLLAAGGVDGAGQAE